MTLTVIKHHVVISGTNMRKNYNFHMRTAHVIHSLLVFVYITRGKCVYRAAHIIQMGVKQKYVQNSGESSRKAANQKIEQGMVR